MIRRLSLLLSLAASLASASDAGLAALANILEGVGQAAQQQSTPAPAPAEPAQTRVDGSSPYCRDDGRGGTPSCFYYDAASCWRAVDIYGGTCIRNPEK